MLVVEWGINEEHSDFRLGKTLKIPIGPHSLIGRILKRRWETARLLSLYLRSVLLDEGARRLQDWSRR
jgi:hypothetical protein